MFYELVFKNLSDLLERTSLCKMTKVFIAKIMKNQKWK